MKYIVFKKMHGDMRRLTPIIFPNTLVHIDVAQTMMAGPLKGWLPDSAGTYVPSSGDCCEKSDTLGLAAKPDRDTLLIRMNDYSVDIMMEDYE